MKLPGKSFFSPSEPKITPLPPPPERTDPAIAAAAEEARLAQLKRKGRAASMLTPTGGLLGDASVSQPQAGAQLLG
jgi:hypothetical protein